MIFTQHSTGFEWYSLQHIGALLVTVTAVVLIIIFKKHLVRTVPGRVVRIALVFLTLLQYLVYYVWVWHQDLFDIRYTLPLELCDIMTLTAVAALLFPNRFLFEAVWFIGIGASLQALATPALVYGFPHFLYFFFFYGHGMVIVTAILISISTRYMLTLWSLLRSMVVLVVLGIVVLGFNLVFKTNYMFLLHKPHTVSLFDLMGPWPVYLFVSLVVAFIVFALLWLLYKGIVKIV